MEMKTRLLLVPALLVTIAALAAGCGGGGSTSVPADAVATVGSTPISKSTFQALMTVAFARYKSQGQPEPKVGTAAYTQLRDQAVGYLVNQEELQQEAQKLGVTVSDSDVAKYLENVKKTYYHGSEKKFEDAMKADHITLAELEQYNIRPTLLSQKLQAKVASSANVSTQDAQQYYNQNKASFTTPKTREVRHILVNSKTLADQIETKLKNGADFAQLAKKYSKDTGSAKQGGKLCVAHGGSSGACTQTVPPFDKASFSLKTHEISQPVKSVYGWHIIQALSPISPSHTQSFSQVEAQIKLQLAQQKKQLAWSNFLAKVKKDYQGKVAYQTGYTPAATTTATAPAQTTTTG
jgi:foldase protein PrsA